VMIEMRYILRFLVLAGGLAGLVFLGSLVPSAVSNIKALATKHENCTVDPQRLLGSWVELSCNDGTTVAGHLAGVEGNAMAIQDAIGKFITHHGGTLTCFERRDRLVNCEAGTASLSEHLALQGFKAKNDTRIAMQGWLATVLAFSGAIVAFLVERNREELGEIEKLGRTKDDLIRARDEIRTVITSWKGTNSTKKQEMLEQQYADLLDHVERTVAELPSHLKPDDWRYRWKGAKQNAANNGNIIDDSEIFEPFNKAITELCENLDGKKT